MKKKTAAVAIIVMLMGVFTHSAWGALAEPVSPGAEEGLAVTGQACPSFSWSAAADAAAYRLEIYELLTDYAISRDQIRQTALPVITKEIPAPAFGWTPSVGECFARGVNYVWYVQGLNASGEGLWSDGRVFGIEPQALTVEQKEAVQEVVREYLETDRSVGTETTDATADSSGAEGKTTSSISLPMTATEGTYNTRLGLNTGSAMGTNFESGTEGVTFIGAHAGYSNTTGYYNSFFGKSAGFYNTTGYYNSFVGRSAGASNTTGYYNSFLGTYAGSSNTTGNSNSFLGMSAGSSNTTGYYNSFLGTYAGSSNTTGNSNSFLGMSAGYSNTTGYSNSFVGYNAGYYNTEGNYNVFLGYAAGYSETGSNKLYVANSSTSTPLIYGEFDNKIVKINGALIMASDERLKKNIEPLRSALEKVMLLKGVSYEWKSATGEGRGFASDREIGLLAQNVETVLPELVHTDGQGYKAVAYDKLAAVLIEAIKEQQTMIKEQQSEIKQKEARIEKLETERALITGMLEELSMRIAAIEKPMRTVASK